MVGLLHPLSYLATGLAFCFCIFSLACGLYYLAELVEEYSVYTKKIIKEMTYVVIVLHVLFFIVDRLPFFYLLFSIFCHLIYSLNLKTFPFINLTSVPFISGCILVFVDHFLWFHYFTKHYRPFMDIAGFFGICVWLVPFAYFISLSANDNALPISDPAFVDVSATPSQGKRGLLSTFFEYTGFKKVETSMPVSSTTGDCDVGFSSAPSNIGMSSGMNFQSSHRDLQSRKGL
ncbi:transmembrane adaptor Erv26-domain-containing protein [Sporodiniella umbellata]|nr:transmembrane adaptor Erv26-domain-containing protein [Sporodiniella umbellata]